MSGYPRWEVLSYDHPAEREKWRELCHRFPPENIDVFYLPEWAYLFELHGDGRALCFVYYENPDRFVIYPFHLRFIRDIPEFRDVDPEWTDIINPYGYGGYLASHPGMDMSGFFRAWREYCRERQVVSELVRFHPLLRNFDYCRPFIPSFRELPVVVIDLTQDPEAIWNGFSPSCRNKIRKAQKKGVIIEVDEELAGLDTFHRLYTETMHRRQARDYYFFSRPWLDHLKNLHVDRAIIFHARHDGTIIASSLFLLKKSYCHYFLSGSDLSAYNTGANNLLLFKAALWARDKSLKFLNLGGGHRTNDELFKFKSSFSAYYQHAYVGYIIVNTKSYKELTDVKINNHEKSDFFPLYRGIYNPLKYKISFKKVIIIGASGHARVCLDILLSNNMQIVGFFDDNILISQGKIHGYPVLGDITESIKYLEKNYCGAFIAIGDNNIRKKVFYKFPPKYKDYFINAVHPSAVISRNVTFGIGNFIAPGVIINTDTEIGSFTIINTGATIDHDNVIHDFAQISPGCNLAGNVTIEEGAFLGTGAVVLPGKTIGAYAIVGAGAVVTQDIPPYCTAVGVPARVIKRHEMMDNLKNARGKS